MTSNIDMEEFDSSNLTTGPFDFVGRTYRYDNGQLMELVHKPLTGFISKGARKSKLVWVSSSPYYRHILFGINFLSPKQAIEHFPELVKLVEAKKSRRRRNLVH